MDPFGERRNIVRAAHDHCLLCGFSIARRSTAGPPAGAVCHTCAASDGDKPTDIWKLPHQLRQLGIDSADVETLKKRIIAAANTSWDEDSEAVTLTGSTSAAQVPRTVFTLREARLNSAIKRVYCRESDVDGVDRVRVDAAHNGVVLAATQTRLFQVECVARLGRSMPVAEGARCVGMEELVGKGYDSCSFTGDGGELCYVAPCADQILRIPRTPLPGGAAARAHPRARGAGISEGMVVPLYVAYVVFVVLVVVFICTMVGKGVDP